MPDTLRLFVGIDPGEAWTRILSAAADRAARSVQANGRKVRPELYHVTVVFLGNQPADAVSRIGAALDGAAAATESFPLGLRQVERLGRHEQGALVAAVDDPSGALQRFRARLDERLRGQDITYDVRSLVPHITLMRPRRKTGPLDAPPIDLRSAPPLEVAEAHLVKSTISQAGPVYQPIHTARFADPHGA